MKKSVCAFMALAGIAGLHAGTVTAPVDKNPASSPEPAAPYSGSIWERTTLTGDWGGFRNDLAAHGVTIALDTVYTFQGVAGGGFDRGNLHDTGNLFSGDLELTFDTGKMGLWPGGFLKVGFQGRGGDSPTSSGGIIPQNNDTLFPNVIGKGGQTAWALTQLNYTQFFSEKFAVFGGLLDLSGADANPITGTIGGTGGFLNTGMLMSLAEIATAPTVTLGGGILLLPTKNIQGTLSVVGTNETAGVNPFDNYEGTTFATEWTFKYDLGEHPGGVTLGAAYSVDHGRKDLASDPRLFFASALLSGQAITTNKDAWCIYWNGYQYLQGDEKKGWGVFGRAGFGDGDPNAVRFSFAAGFGGTSPFLNRDGDRWGLGMYYVDFSNLPVLESLRINHEIGGELFYNIALTKWAHLTLDAQVVDGAIQRADTAVVLGTRLVIDF
jgi:porin